jgi:hypothetical protein
MIAGPSEQRNPYLTTTVEGQGRKNPMRFRPIMIGLFMAGIALLVCLTPYSQTIYALASRNLEMVFVVTDAETGELIPNASIDLMAEEYKENGLERQVIKLVTDNEGRARFVHENNSCEDVIRPFKKTVTLIDLTWASITVSGKGYSPVEQMWLHTAKYKNKGYFSEGPFQQVEFNVSLHKRTDN